MARECLNDGKHVQPKTDRNPEIADVSVKLLVDELQVRHDS